MRVNYCLFSCAGGILLAIGCAEQVAEVPPGGVEEVPAETRSGANPSEEAQKPAAAPKKKGTLSEVDLNRVLQLQDERRVVFVDVRPTLFYTLGHLPEAISVPKKSFPRSLTKKQTEIDAAVAAGKVVVLYCQNVECPDGYAVGKEMVEMGYSVSLYKGGWEEWEQMGF